MRTKANKCVTPRHCHECHDCHEALQELRRRQEAFAQLDAVAWIKLAVPGCPEKEENYVFIVFKKIKALLLALLFIL